ncbi:MAG: GNAT family N-acetyltransferase [Bacteroidetes bacterium]|nr:GNAT family N-acetyltransferase [Bacteroidota bacterium]
MEKFAQAYKIITDRLLIRSYVPTDAELLQSSINESMEHLRPWIPWAQDEPQPIDWFAQFIRKFRGQFDLGQDAVYGIFNPTETAIIGGTGLHNRVGPEAREIGYWINVNHVDKGYATEAVCALVRTGFEIEKHSLIEIHCASDNVRSNHVPEKLGFRHDSTVKNAATDRHGRFRDIMIWTLSADAYASGCEKIHDTPIKAYDFLDRPIPI